MLLRYLTGLPRLIPSSLTEQDSASLQGKVSSSPVLAQSAATPPGLLVFAFGDVHGQFELLNRMLQKIRVEVASTSGLRAHIIGLGDYIDRGPDSARVLDLLVGLSRDRSLDFTALKGNHEDVFLQFLDKPKEIGPLWMQIGGEDTLHSYGLSLPGRPAASEFLKVRDDLASRLPTAHLSLMLNLSTRLTLADYFFCHAGIRHGVPLEDQSDQDLMWLRKGHTRDGEHLEKIIVHGHKPVMKPEIRPYRINVDTGAYLTGVLSCVVLDGNQVRAIQVSHSSGTEPDANLRQY